MPLNAVASYLQFLRKGHGLSQEELAMRIGVPVAEIEQFERAQGSEVSDQTLAKIVVALGGSTEHVRYLYDYEPQDRADSSRIIREGIDLAKGVLRGGTPPPKG